MISTSIRKDKKIGKSTFVVYNEKQEKMILKSPYKKKGSIFLRQDLSSLNEVLFYSEISSKKNKGFNIPELVDVTENKYIFMKPISGTKGINWDLVTKNQLTQDLINFNMYKREKKLPFIPRVFSKITRSQEFKIVRFSTKLYLKEINTIEFFNIFQLLLSSFFNTKKVFHNFLLHNDLYGLEESYSANNMVTDSEGKLYFCDFESITNERRWIFTDIVDLSLGSETIILDSGLLRVYINSLKEQYNITLNKEDISTRVRISMLRRLLQLMNSNATSIKKKKMYRLFLTETLLCEKAYKSFLKNQNLI